MKGPGDFPGPFLCVHTPVALVLICDHCESVRIKIVRRPTGEAPEWVRDAWIGLSLPLAAKQPQTWAVFGVLSAPRGWHREFWAILSGKTTKATGYLVNARQAVDQLATFHPEAAAWWREHTPQLVSGRRNFLFDVDACAPDLSTRAGE